MTTDECYRLGRITKPFGLKGEVIFFLDVDEPDNYAGLDSVFVETKNGLVPYFIKKIQINGNKATVAFDELSAEEQKHLYHILALGAEVAHIDVGRHVDTRQVAYVHGAVGVGQRRGDSITAGFLVFVSVNHSDCVNVLIR